MNDRRKSDRREEIFYRLDKPYKHKLQEELDLLDTPGGIEILLRRYSPKYNRRAKQRRETEQK